MFVLSKIFGDYPQVKILEVLQTILVKNYQFIIWLADMPKTTIYSYIGKYDRILLEGEKVLRQEKLNFII